MKLPKIFCRILGHKVFYLSYTEFISTGRVAMCLRCGKGLATHPESKVFGWFTRRELLKWASQR